MFPEAELFVAKGMVKKLNYFVDEDFVCDLENNMPMLRNTG